MSMTIVKKKCLKLSLSYVLYWHLKEEIPEKEKKKNSKRVLKNLLAWKEFSRDQSDFSVETLCKH